MIIQKEENHGDYLTTRQHPQQNRIFIEKNSFCAFGGISWVWCITSCLIHTMNTNSRHDRIILLRDITPPHVAVSVKNYLKTLVWEVLPHPPYSLDIGPSDYHLFRSMAHALSEQRFTSYEDTNNWVDAWIISKIRSFSDLKSEHCLKDRKSSC
ncbi:Mariner Mos1 transposase [Eumeta japonica]|uniref:Mariner Mos1 transposase n=1 Tax=Eumeta variegata TaxID=151549 RepID=A0A4C1WHK8_EUMVA|nr:Mariner Mos1 transposase [Eumeta japonica]